MVLSADGYIVAYLSHNSRLRYNLHMFWKRLFLISIVSSELIVIIWLCFLVIQKTSQKQNVLGAESVTRLHKENLIFPTDPTLKFFYESEPSKTYEEQPKWLPEKAIYTINPDGLNDRYEYSIDKPRDTFRIITLGDSFTFGHYISTPNNWSERLEDMLNTQLVCKNTIKFEVINMGQPGYDIQYIAHRYKTRGLKYNPDLLIWLESGTGFDRFNEIKAPYQKKYEQQFQTAGKLNTTEDYTRAYQLAMKDIHAKYSQTELDTTLDSWWKDFIVTRQQTPLIVTMYNDEPSSHVSRLRHFAQTTTRMYVADIISGRNATQNTLPDGHPNANGHLQIARDTYDFLTRLGFLLCDATQSP